MSQAQTRSELLKLIAIVSMVCDHIGAVLLPQYPILRIIGRIAFPIFAYQLAVGYAHTSNVRRYELRLLLFALLSQLPFSLYFDTSGANIMVTLLTSLIIMERFAKREWYVAVLILLVPYFLRNDYGVFGVLLPLLFYWTRGQEKWVAFLLLSLLNTVYSGYIGIIYGVWWQLFGVIGIAIALWMPSIKVWRWKINKYVFYGFYPVHLALLWLLHVFVF